MFRSMKATGVKIQAKEKILAAALDVIRAQGYNATTVDDLCAAAGVTKGAFFHHFKSKEDLAIQSVDHWSKITGELFERAPYHEPKDPLDRVMGYVAFRASILQGEIPEFTCLVGTLVQEVYDTNPAIREVCEKCIWDHASTVAKDIDEAKKLYAPRASFTGKGLALHMQAVLQGAFILAKAKRDSAVAADSLAHLKNYVEMLFENSKPRRKSGN